MGAGKVKKVKRVKSKVPPESGLTFLYIFILLKGAPGLNARIMRFEVREKPLYSLLFCEVHRGDGGAYQTTYENHWDYSCFHSKSGARKSGARKSPKSL